MLYCGFAFIGRGRQVAQGRVQTDVVVEPDDVIGNVTARLGVVGVVVLPDPLPLQIEEEALHDGVVPAIAFATHAARQAMTAQQGTVGFAGVPDCPGWNARSGPPAVGAA